MPSNDSKTTEQNKSNGGDKKTENAGASSSQQHQKSNAVGHYILGKALGEGTFGKVKLGTHILSGEKVAVKVLEKSRIKDKKDVERISREIKILKQLHHPNVVQIYEIIETEKDLYLVMEYASGGELFDLIVQNQRLKERTASKYFQELVAGVHYIHKLGICHRDLKPENLLIDFDKSLKIVDFGLSNTYEKGQTLKTACGSPCYAAPEMIAGNRYHGLKSDLWSCGVVLYAMLCGYLPFEDQKTSNLYKKILNADYTLPKFLSADARDFLGRIFETNPDKRIDIDGIRAHPWYKLQQPECQAFNYHGQKVRISSKIVQKLEAQLGFNRDSVERSVQNNKHNHLSATYYLIWKKHAAQAFKAQQSAAPSAQHQPSKSIIVKSEDKNQSQERAPKKRSSSSHHPSSSVAQPSQPQPRERERTTEPTSHSPAKEENEKKQVAISQSGRSSSKGHAKQVASGSVQQAQPHYNPHKPSERTDEFLGRNEIRVAPVQDQLVLKNHRREQSANATASRPNKHSNTWGEDERRTESYHRPAHADDYEVVISKQTNSSKQQQSSAIAQMSASVDRKQGLSQTQPQAARTSSIGATSSQKNGSSTPVQQSSHQSATTPGSNSYNQRRKSGSTHPPGSSAHTKEPQQPQISSKLRSSSAAQKSADTKKSNQIATSTNAEKTTHLKLASTQIIKDSKRQTKSVVAAAAIPDDLNKYFYSSNGTKTGQKAVAEPEAIVFKNQQPQVNTTKTEAAPPAKPNPTSGSASGQQNTPATNNFMLMSDLQHMLSQKSYFDSIVSSSNNRAAAAADVNTASSTTAQQNKDLLVGNISTGTGTVATQQTTTTGLNLNSTQQPRATSVNVSGGQQPAAALMTSLHDTISTTHSKNVGNYGQLSHQPGSSHSRQAPGKDGNGVIMIRDGQYHSYNRENSSNSRTATNNSGRNCGSQPQSSKVKSQLEKSSKQNQRTSTVPDADQFTLKNFDYNKEDLQRYKQPVSSSGHHATQLQIQEQPGGVQGVVASSPSSMIATHTKAVFYGTIPISSTSASNQANSLQPKPPSNAFNLTQTTAGTAKQSSSTVQKHSSSTNTNKLSKTQQYVPTTSKLSSQQVKKSEQTKNSSSGHRTSQSTKTTSHSHSQQNSRGRSADVRQQTQTVQQANLLHHQQATNQLSHLQYNHGSVHGQRSHSTTASMQHHHHPNSASTQQNQVSQSMQISNKGNSITQAANIYAQSAAAAANAGPSKNSTGKSTRIDTAPGKESQGRRRAQSCSYQTQGQQVQGKGGSSQDSRQRNRSQQHHTRSSHNSSSQPNAAALLQQQQQSQMEREHTKQLLMRSLDLTLQHQQAQVAASSSVKRNSTNMVGAKTTTSRSKQQVQHHTHSSGAPPSMSEQDINRFYKQLVMQQKPQGLTEDQQISAKMLKQQAATTKVHGTRYASNSQNQPANPGQPQVGNYMMSVPGTYYQQTRKERDEVMTQYLLNQTLTNQNQNNVTNRAQQVVAASNKIVQGASAQSNFARKVAQLDQTQQISSKQGPPLTLHTNFFHPNSGNSLSSTDRLMSSADKMQAVIPQQFQNVHPSRPGAGKAVAATDLGIDMKSVLLGNVISNNGKTSSGKQQMQSHQQQQHEEQLQYYSKMHQQMQSSTINQAQPTQQTHNRGYGVVPPPTSQLNATSLVTGKQQQPAQYLSSVTASGNAIHHYNEAMDARSKSISPTSIVTTQKQQAQQQYAMQQQQQQQQQQYFSGTIPGENRLSFTRFCQ